MSRSGAAYSGIRLVFTGVTGHLRQGAAGAEKGAAQVLASMAVLLRNRVLSSDALSGAAETVQRPNSKQGAAHELQDDDPRGVVAGPVFQRRHLQRRRVDHVRDQQEQHHLEGVPGGHLLPRLSQPRQRHAGHDLRHGDLAAEKGATPGGVTDPRLEAVEEAVLPSSGGCVDAFVPDRGGEGRQEPLPFFDAAFGLRERQKRDRETGRNENGGKRKEKNPCECGAYDPADNLRQRKKLSRSSRSSFSTQHARTHHLAEEGPARVVVQEGLEGVSGGKRRGGDDADHQRPGVDFPVGDVDVVFRGHLVFMLLPTAGRSVEMLL